MAAPAAAAEARASNFQTRLASVEPAVPGLWFAVVEVGNRVEVVNRTGTDVVVLGYEGEPFLRVGPEGVFENRRSPAAYLSRDRQATVPVPEDADPTAPAEWVRLGAGQVARWYDHRVHWMGAEPPPAVRLDPAMRHVIIPEWTVAMRHGGREVTARGELVWVPGPSPVPWLMVSALPGGALSLAWGSARWTGRRRPYHRLIAAGLAVAVGLSAVSTLAREGPQPVARLLPLAAAWLAGGAAVALLLRGRRAPAGYTLAAVAAAVILVVGGSAGLADLSRSQVPSQLPAAAARAAVALTLGVAAAVGVAALAAAARPRPPKQAVEARGPTP